MTAATHFLANTGLNGDHIKRQISEIAERLLKMHPHYLNAFMIENDSPVLQELSLPSLPSDRGAEMQPHPDQYDYAEWAAVINRLAKSMLKTDSHKEDISIALRVSDHQVPSYLFAEQVQGEIYFVLRTKGDVNPAQAQFHLSRATRKLKSVDVFIRSAQHSS